MAVAVAVGIGDRLDLVGGRIGRGCRHAGERPEGDGDGWEGVAGAFGDLDRGERRIAADPDRRQRAQRPVPQLEQGVGGVGDRRPPSTPPTADNLVVVVVVVGGGVPSCCGATPVYPSAPGMPRPGVGSNGTQP